MIVQYNFICPMCMYFSALCMFRESVCRHCLLQLTCRVGGSTNVGTSLRGLLLLISPEMCQEGTVCMNDVATADWKSLYTPCAIQILPHILLCLINIYRIKNHFCRGLINFQ